MADRFGVEAVGLKQLVAAVRKADPVIARQLLTRIKSAAGIIVDDATARAQWSTRIPGSIRATASGKVVSIRAGGPGAADAAPLEHGGVAGSIRHPVFGTDVWVDQPARPFLTPAGQAHDADLLAAVDAALDDWLTEIGFK